MERRGKRTDEKDAEDVQGRAVYAYAAQFAERSMIPAGRQLYLEMARLNPDRKFREMCFRNFVRVLNKEKKPLPLTGAEIKLFIRYILSQEERHEHISEAH